MSTQNMNAQFAADEADLFQLLEHLRVGYIKHNMDDYEATCQACRDYHQAYELGVASSVTQTPAGPSYEASDLKYVESIVSECIEKKIDKLEKLATPSIKSMTKKDPDLFEIGRFSGYVGSAKQLVALKKEILRKLSAAKPAK